MDARFHAAIGLIYDAAVNPAIWPDALHVIAASLNAKGAILIWQKDDGNFGTVASQGVADAQVDYVNNGWSERDIRARRSIERGYFFNGEPFGDIHVCSQQELLTDPFYCDFLAVHNLKWFGAVAVSPDPHTAVALSVQRSASSESFNENDLDAISKVGLHVEKSLRLSIKLMDAEISRIGFAEAFDRIGVAAFVLDGLGRVMFSNRAAKSVIGDGVAVVEEKLIPMIADDRARFEEFISAAIYPQSSRRDRETVLLSRGHAKKPLVAQAIGLSDQNAIHEQFLRRVSAIVLVSDPSATGYVDPSVVRDFLGLTLGEARVASLVGSGLSPRDASIRLGIAEDTVRNVLKRVFAKAGVTRQPELVAVISGLSLLAR